MRTSRRSQELFGHTFLIEGQFVEPESAGFFAHKLVRALGTQVVQGHGVRQGLHARLQTEGNFGVACGVSAPGCKGGDKLENTRAEQNFGRQQSHLCPSTVHRETPHKSGLNLAS